MKLRWVQLGRANYRADDGDGGHYSIDRFGGEWVKIHVYRSASMSPTDPPQTRPVPWMRPNARRTLNEAKASCQQDVYLQERSEA